MGYGGSREPRPAVAPCQDGTGGFGGGCKSCSEMSPNCGGRRRRRVLGGSRAWRRGWGAARLQWGGGLMWCAPGEAAAVKRGGGGPLGAQWRQRGEQPMRGAAGEVMHRGAAAIGPGAAARRNKRVCSQPRLASGEMGGGRDRTWTPPHRDGLPRCHRAWSGGSCSQILPPTTTGRTQQGLGGLQGQRDVTPCPAPPSAQAWLRG